MNHAVAFRCLLLLLAGAFSGVAQPVLNINRTGGGPVRLSFEAEPGYAYQIEGSSSLAPGSIWSSLATFAPLGGTLNWNDSQYSLGPRRFYRTVQWEPAPAEIAPDFRLIDQMGRSTRLYYNFGVPAIRSTVLIFTGNGCAKIREMAPAINSLRSRFGGQGVLFWLIDSNSGDTRSNILAEATSLGWSNNPPILHDLSQTVARSYHAMTTPEAVAIDMGGLSIFYRGAIDDRIGAGALATTQHYLSNALTAFLAGDANVIRASQAMGCDIQLRPTGAVPSYTQEIAPLLQLRCVRCHSSGNIAPWTMSSHAEVSSRADEIRFSVMTGEMPPWHADPEFGAFSNDSSLRPTEKARLIQWLDAGAPRGLGSDPLVDSPPPATNYPAAWPSHLGQPDAILRIPPQTISASGTVAYQYFNVINTAFTTNVWLKAAVVRPTNPKVVHHSLVFQGTGGLMGLDGFFAGYVPGMEPAAYPAGTSKRLRSGETLRFQMHYTTVGTVQTDQTEIGLYVSPTPPTYELQTKSAFNLLISIPPNRNDYEQIANYPSSGTLSTNIMLYELSPHMHLRGSKFKYEVILPTGKRETILSVPHYVFHWQALYRLTQPRYIPKGSRIVCTAGWDNTAQNIELMEAYESSGNPEYLPSQTVTFNEQSWDEMFIGYLNYAEVP